MSFARILCIVVVVISTNAGAGTVSLEYGEKIYRAYCSQCHGIDGDGRGINAEYVPVQPSDHTDREAMESRTDAELFEITKFGGRVSGLSIHMPGWQDNLSDADIDSLVLYLRQLCCRPQ